MLRQLGIGRRAARLARLVLAVVMTAGALVAVGPANPAWAVTVRVAASDDNPMVGSDVVITAARDVDDGRKFSINGPGGGVVCTGRTCRYTRGWFFPGTIEFHARVCIDDGCTMVVAEDTVAVTFREPVRECYDVPSPAEICRTLGREYKRVTIYEGEVLGGPKAIAGYVDQYRFAAGTTTATIACPMLWKDGTETNPCAQAGGTFVRRMATLLDTESYEEADTPDSVATAAVCHTTLSVLVAGLGVDETPIYQLC